jgi:hypothetical protein
MTFCARVHHRNGVFFLIILSKYNFWEPRVCGNETVCVTKAWVSVMTLFISIQYLKCHLELLITFVELLQRKIERLHGEFGVVQGNMLHLLLRFVFVYPICIEWYENKTRVKAHKSQYIKQKRLSAFYSMVVFYVPPGYTWKNYTFCPHSEFMFFVWFLEQRLISSLYNCNVFVFHNLGEVCLLRGTNWTFKYVSGLSWSLKVNPLTFDMGSQRRFFCHKDGGNR